MTRFLGETNMWQVASKEDFEACGIDVTGARQLKQEGEYHNMYVKHLELSISSEDDLQFMWEESVYEMRYNLIPITRAQLDEILANEPPEEI